MRRREFLKVLGTGAGLSALLAACRRVAAPTPTATPKPAAVATPTVGPTPGVSPTVAVAPTPTVRPAAVTITWSVQSFAHQALQPFLDEFKALTGITVRLESGPALARIS